MSGTSLEASGGMTDKTTPKLFVVARPDPSQEGGTEIRSETAIYAETPEDAAECYIAPPEWVKYGDVPDAWYDTDVAFNVKEVDGLLVFGPY